MHSNYARQSLPSLPASVLADPALKSLAALYREHAEVLAECQTSEGDKDDAVAALALARSRFDREQESEARVRYDVVRATSAKATGRLIDIAAKVRAQVVAERKVIRPLIVKALQDAHAEAVQAVERAKQADREQRDAADALRNIDVLAVAARPDLDEEDRPWLMSAVADLYETRRTVADPSVLRRRNLGLSWRDVTESVSGLPVDLLVRDDALTSSRVSDALAEVTKRKERRARQGGAA